MGNSKLIFALVFIGLFLTMGLVGSTILSLVINDATDTISMQHNLTENTNSSFGVRLDAPVLFMSGVEVLNG